MCILQLAVIWTCYRVFPIVMQDETICRQLLGLILGKKIGAVRFDDETTFDKISMEKTLTKGAALKAVKLDVFATDELAWYNVKMLAKGMAPELIEELTGLTEDEIKKLDCGQATKD